MATDIVLSTLNTRYIHSAFGLRYLLANLGALRDRAPLCEFDLHTRPADVVEALLSQNPRIVALGVSIWNVAALTRVLALLKRLAPKVITILGGPEVSYESESQEIVHLADFVVTGEAEDSFRELCGAILNGSLPAGKIIPGLPPDLASLCLPYSLYSDSDLRERVLYVEASRGCPFSCEFCLSALDSKVRYFPLGPFLAEMQTLLKRGGRLGILVWAGFKPRTY
jgi:radical SAM superfamily enzyme YgiQ (UPF0313 family)